MRTFCVMSFAVLLTSCATLDISSDYDTNADFSALRTWKWAPRAGATDDPQLRGALVHGRVRTAVERELGLKGYRQTAGDVDFLVGYHVAVEQKIGVQLVNDYYGYAPSIEWHDHGRQNVMVTHTEPRVYDQGSLIIDIVDATSNELVWRGSAQAEVHTLDSTEKRKQRVRDAVTKILARFPPQ